MNKFRRIVYDAASSVPENASFLSVRQSFHLSSSIPKDALVQVMLQIFQELTPAISQNGIIPGHLKAAVQAKTALLALSATRADSIDQTPNQEWISLKSLQDFEIRINLLSILPCSVNQKELEQMLHGKITALSL